MRNLVIVESPTKARTIGRFLGPDYIIKASMGHVVDLPKSTLGVDLEHDFAPQYELMKDKKKIVAELKTAAKNADLIILATDPDREGEAIAYHVKDMISSSSKLKMQSSKFKRIVFHEITKEAIEEAFKNPRSIDVNLVNAQTARRVLDRLVGYKLSPLLWQKVRRGLSAGRVQSIALRLIVERQREIEKFKREKYFTIHIILNSLQDSRNEGKEMPKQVRHDKELGTEFELVEINGEKIELQNSFQLYDGEYKVTKTSIDLKEKADQILKDLQGKEFTVSDVLQKSTKRNPQAPYTTSTLQQDASRRLGFSGKRTMSVAQKLYEEGFITYHRTDSITMSTQAILAIRSFVEKEYGKNYIPEKQRLYTAKQKNAQEAHEAIRPTRTDGIQNSSIRKTQDKIQNDVGNDGWRLYELIWRRAVASQMSEAVIESTTVFAATSRQPRIANDARSNISDNQLQTRSLSESGQQSNIKDQNNTKSAFSSFASGLPSRFVNSYKFKANGSVLVFDGFLKINPQALEDKRLPEFKAGEHLDLTQARSEEHETLPPPKYNDASLIKTLEEKGIGRPSTYAAIISTIEDRGYIERDQPAGGKRFTPTPVGMAVNDFLVKNFSTIDDIPFTADMEDQLDAVASGEKKWAPVIKDFYSPFEKKLEEVKKADRVQIAVDQTNEKCPKCSSLLVVRHGKFGKFLSCSTFPKCDFTKQFVEETNLACPKCAGLPAGRQGKVIIKTTKRGRKFYGCSNYPACEFASWTLPKNEKPSINDTG